MTDKILRKIRNLSENDWNVLRNVVYAFGIKGAAVVLSLFTMPAYIRFFENEISLGLWFTVLSVLTWVLNFDLGIGNGLRNYLTMALAEKNQDDARKYISSAYFAIGFLTLAFSAAFCAVCGFVDWNQVFNIEEQVVSAGALVTAVRIVFIGMMVQFFLRLISSVLYALQKSSVNNFLDLCTAVITLAAIRLLPSRGNDINFITMAIVHALAVALPLLTATIIVFSGTLKQMRPAIRMFSLRHARVVCTLGGQFFLVQIMYMLIMSTNEYLITALAGNADVVEYQIYYKIFSLGSTVFTLALTPIWSAVTKAFAERNIIWIRKLFKILCGLAAAGTVCEFGIVLICQPVVNLWLGSEAIAMNRMYAVWFAALGSLMIMNGVLSSIDNGIGELKTQTICFAIGTVVKFVLAWILVDLTGSWIGVVMANVISMALYCASQPFSIKKEFQRASMN